MICILLRIFVDVWISLVIFALLFVIFQCMSPGKVRKMISMFSYTWMYIDFALFIFLKNPLTPNLCLINASAFTSLLFGFCFRENTDQYVFLCFAHTHFIFIWSFFYFFYRNRYDSLLFHVLINCIKVRLYFLGKNEWGRYFTFISSAGLAIPQFTFLFT